MNNNNYISTGLQDMHKKVCFIPNWCILADAQAWEDIIWYIIDKIRKVKIKLWHSQILQDLVLDIFIIKQTFQFDMFATHGGRNFLSILQQAGPVSNSACQICIPSQLSCNTQACLHCWLFVLEEMQILQDSFQAPLLLWWCPRSLSFKDCNQFLVWYRIIGKISTPLKIVPLERSTPLGTRNFALKISTPQK